MPKSRHAEAVDQAERVGRRDPDQRLPERGQVRLVQAARVDPAHAARHDHRLRRRAHDERVELLAAGLGVLLRVVEPRERAPVGERQPLQVEEDRGSEQRARQAAAAGLVGARDEAVAELAVEREQAPAAALR